MWLLLSRKLAPDPRPTAAAAAAAAAAAGGGAFSHVRFMEWTASAIVLGFANASSPGLGVSVAWADRARLTDAV